MMTCDFLKYIDNKIVIQEIKNFLETYTMRKLSSASSSFVTPPRKGSWSIRKLLQAIVASRAELKGILKLLKELIQIKIQ